MFTGTLTVQNVDSGIHRTLKVYRQKDDASFAPGEMIASLLTGPDNTWRDFTGFGFVGQDGAVKMWRSKANLKGYGRMLQLALRAIGAVVDTADDTTVNAIVDSGDVEARFEADGKTYSVLMSVRCCRCGRKLTVPESVRSGIGPICASR